MQGVPGAGHWEKAVGHAAEAVAIAPGDSRRAAVRPVAGGRLLIWALVLVLTALIAIRAIYELPDHDESQYVAGAYFAGRLMIFRDFMHLQTPLQAWLFAPIAALFPTNMYIAMRLANALLAGATLAVVVATCRRLGTGWIAAAVAALFLGLCQPMQASATLVRNDILPMLFCALAVLAGVVACRERRPLAWPLSGVCFGLAVSTKVSYAFPAAAAGLFLLVRLARPDDRRQAWTELAAFSSGGTLGLLPTLIAFAVAPDAFLWGVVTYGASAPFDWYRANGLNEMLTLSGKAAATFQMIGRSPALPALVLLLPVMLWRRRLGRPDIAFLDAVVIGGLIAALLPTPTWPYYFMTLLPVLFVRLAVELDRLGRAPRIVALVIGGVFAVSTVFMLDWTLRHFIASPASAYAMPRAESEAHWIGERLRAAGVRGKIATLVPHRVLDSGYPVDPRFATGVFVYRSGGLLHAAGHERFHTVGPQTVAGWFDRSQPAAIVTGYEAGTDRFHIQPDARLRAYAQARSYRLERSPFGRAELYINPHAVAADGPSRDR